MTDEKAFLIHVVAIMKLNVILNDLFVENSEILSIRMLWVSFVPFEVYSAEIFAVKLIFVSASESGSPILARLCTIQSSSSSPHHR